MLAYIPTRRAAAVGLNEIMGKKETKHYKQISEPAGDDTGARCRPTARHCGTSVVCGENASPTQ